MADIRFAAMLASLRALLVPFAVALILAGIVLIVIGENPLAIFGLLAEESFGSARRIASTLSLSLIHISEPTRPY